MSVNSIELTSEILRLKKQKNILLLAHYYQIPEIQDLADYVGDSLGLSQYAASVQASTIAFAGVHFMAETAKILSPHKKVVLPDLKAGCSLAGAYHKCIMVLNWQQQDPPAQMTDTYDLIFPVASQVIL